MFLLLLKSKKIPKQMLNQKNDEYYNCDAGLFTTFELTDNNLVEMGTKEPDIDAVSDDDMDEQSGEACKQPSKEMNNCLKTLVSFAQYCAEAMPLVFRLKSLYYK